MAWEEHEEEYLQYVAQHESGFLCDQPPAITTMEEVLHQLVYGDEYPIMTIQLRPSGETCGR